MVFSDTSAFGGILQDINFRCELPPADTTEFPTDDKVRLSNINYRTVLAWIWMAQGGWTFDDTNLTDLPVFKTDCVNGQTDYALPTNYGIVERIEVKDADGIWILLSPITRGEIKQSLAEFNKTATATPVYVELFANAYRMYPAINRTSVDGDSIRVYCTRDIDAFTSADTTQEPGFNRNFHHIIPIMTAKDWAIVHKPDMVPALIALIAQIKSDLMDFYGNRGNLRQERIQPKKRQHNAR